MRTQTTVLSQEKCDNRSPERNKEQREVPRRVLYRRSSVLLHGRSQTIVLPSVLEKTSIGLVPSPWGGKNSIK